MTGLLELNPKTDPTAGAPPLSVLSASSVLADCLAVGAALYRSSAGAPVLVAQITSQWSCECGHGGGTQEVIWGHGMRRG